MRKRGIIVSVIWLIIVITIVVIMYNFDKDMTFTEDGIMYAVNVDGKKQNDFPLKGLYNVDLTCENSKGKWDYDNWKLYVENITGVVSCNITFTTISKTYLNNKIISLAGTTQGTGQVVNENGYRYEGKNPNNYIWFNNELWRIIGVFGSESHGVANTNLVKIIKEESLGALVWNNPDDNNWSTSSLKKLWNPIEGDSASGSYYNKTNGTGNTYCYGYSTKVPANCDYRVNGIDATYRGMIKNVTWYLGGMSYTSNDANYYETTIDNYYKYERDATSKYSGNPATDTGYIGLMYASDYGYSVLASSCPRTTTINEYAKDECAGQSWLYKGEEWMITHYSSYSYMVMAVGIIGNSGAKGASSSNKSRPVLYLDSSVYVLDGDGSILDPYIITM